MKSFPAGVVGPAHASGLAEGERAGFGAVEAHALVALGVAGLEGCEVVVVVVYALGEGGGGGGLGHEWSGKSEKDEEFFHWTNGGRAIAF